jgi:RNA polymerase sigma-70 factor (ECF subfamily)
VTATPDLVGIDSALLAVVRVTAAGLAWKYCFNGIDLDDIRQELFLDCLFRFGKFDPARSSRSTFLRRVVRHRIATLLDAQRAGCRDHRRCRDSLDARVQFAAGESVPLEETLSADDYDARIGRNTLSSRERLELRIDVDSAISLLPADLAGVAILLKSVGVAEAAQQLGLSRATAYRRVASIRAAFASTGLNRYLNRSVIASVP